MLFNFRAKTYVYFFDANEKSSRSTMLKKAKTMLYVINVTNQT